LDKIIKGEEKKRTSVIVVLNECLRTTEKYKQNIIEKDRLTDRLMFLIYAVLSSDLD